MRKKKIDLGLCDRCPNYAENIVVSINLTGDSDFTYEYKKCLVEDYKPTGKMLTCPSYPYDD